VLAEVNTKFARGEHIAVIGKVGSGKSTLLLTILGEVPVAFGSI
jgi:ABC-type transport system involved in cytochrome bd biosynthesis fused ATPase/permease subunit